MLSPRDPPSTLATAEPREATFAARFRASAPTTPVLPGFDGAGVTRRILDTGVDATHPFVRDRVLDGSTCSIRKPPVARPHPMDPTRLERSRRPRSPA